MPVSPAPGAIAVVGGTVVAPDGAARADVIVVDGQVANVGTAVTIPPGTEVLDGAGMVVAPGFVDVQINGGYGIDLARKPERLGELAAALPRHGVTAFCPTIVSSPPGVVTAALAAAQAWAPSPGGPPSAVPVGLHLEGPMLEPVRRGAHDPRHLRPPSAAVIDGWSRQAGVAIVTLAPERPGALAVISALAQRGVVVAAGHTDATAAELTAGVGAGITALTHLFNAMRPFSHRDPGPIGVALSGGIPVVGLIVDGVHVDPVAVAMAWRALGPVGIALVTDAVASMGTNPHLDAARLADGTLAGSTITMDGALRNLMTFTGCTLADAVTSAATTPARLLGDGARGVIEPGRRGDLVVLTPAGVVVATIIGGTVAWHR